MNDAVNLQLDNLVWWVRLGMLFLVGACSLIGLALLYLIHRARELTRYQQAGAFLISAAKQLITDALKPRAVKPPTQPSTPLPEHQLVAVAPSAPAKKRSHKKKAQPEKQENTDAPRPDPRPE